MGLLKNMLDADITAQCEQRHKCVVKDGFNQSCCATFSGT